MNAATATATVMSGATAIVADTPGERDLLLSALRVASARSRICTNVFHSIGFALRSYQIDCAGALAWLDDEGLLEYLPLGPARPKAAIHWQSPGWKVAIEEYHADRRRGTRP